MDHTYLSDCDTQMSPGVTGCSLVGFSETDSYPRNWGNYFFMQCEDGKSREVANFWLEDLEHLIVTNKITFPVKVKILDDKWLMIYDERIPENFYSETSYRAPQKYWSLKQLMAHQLKLDNSENAFISSALGQIRQSPEKFWVKTEPRKLDGTYTVEPLSDITFIGLSLSKSLGQKSI